MLIIFIFLIFYLILLIVLCNGVKEPSAINKQRRDIFN